MTESQFKSKVVKKLKEQLADAWIYHPSDKWVSGVPDLLVLYKSVFAAIELKVGRNKATKLQDIILARISKAGGMTWVVTESGDGLGMAHIKTIIATIKMRAGDYTGE